MFRTYRDLYRAPGTIGFSLAGLLARITISTVGLGIVLLISGLHGRYALAGAVAATYSLVAAIVAPRLGRLTDRHGQSRILAVCTLLLCAGVAALLAGVVLGASDWVLFPAAALSGCGNASVGALVRARWARIYGGTDRLHAAYSLESVIDEVVFMAGPILVTLLVTQVSPIAGLLVVVAIATIGMLALAAQRGTEPAPVPSEGGRAGTVLRLRPMRVLAVIWLGAGCLLGSIEVVTIAYVSQLGHRGLTGFLLAGWALGSALAGLVYGALKLRASRRRRLAIGIVAMWLVTFLLLLPLSLPALAVVLFISGLTIAPTLVTGFGMVEAVVPRSRLTEGMTWASTSLNLGATAGTAIAGWAVDHLGSQLAYTTSLAGGAVAMVAATVGWRWLRADRDT